MSINVNDKNLGHATAYAYYKAGGGTMTEAEFTEFMADFGTASQTAVEAAQAALASKNAAQTAATTATNKATEATTAATTATTKAGEASTSASTATSAKDTAVSAASTATTKATEATTAAATAVNAKDDAVSANTSAQSAKTAAQTAQTGAETAAASVQSSAEQIATNAADISQLKSDLTQLNNTVGESASSPMIYQDLTKYANELTGVSSVSDIHISAGTTIKNVKIYSVGHTNTTMCVFIIRQSDNVCVFLKSFREINAGWNTIDINYTCESACYIGQYGTGVKYTNSSVTSDYRFSYKVRPTDPYIPSLNEVVTITERYSGNFALSMYWETETGLIADVSSTSAAANKALEKVENPYLYDHPCIVSFIDDDTGQYVPEIWGAILAESPIRMGFACITGFMSGDETGVSQYTPMTLAELKNLYADGHEVYSHSYSHPAFYSDNTTVEMINEQCWKSKDWLFENDFCRGSDIIVYPGGLGESKYEKQGAIRQYYRYGVDTVGGGVNPEPLNPYCIYRYNADTATLAELKAKVDDAVSQSKLLVFMNHAYELKSDEEIQVAKMIALIEYIKTTSAEILPLGEALHKIYGWDYHFKP